MKNEFAKGLFIKNDDNGNPCHVGDTVKVNVGEGELKLPTDWDEQEDGQYLEPEEYMGTLVLLKSKGVAVRLPDGSYVHPALTKNSIREWKWKLLK